MNHVTIRALETRPARVFTVDVEDWFHSNFTSAPDLDTTHLARRVEHGVERLLEALAQRAARATFFVLGEVAAAHPTLVERIARAGHELGCHGWSHTLVYRQAPDELRQSIKKARALIQDQSGQPVRGFRAPSWSITRDSLWALDVIHEVGFSYDSSIFPAANYLYGIDSAPSVPHEIETSAGHRLVELPPSTIGAGARRMGVAGGVYLRVLPLAVHRAAMRRALREGRPFMVYTHPREFDPGSWNSRLPLSLTEDAIFRVGLRRGHQRLLALLDEGPWVPLGDVFESARRA